MLFNKKLAFLTPVKVGHSNTGVLSVYVGGTNSALKQNGFNQQQGYAFG